MSRVMSMFLSCFLLCLGESSTFVNHWLISNLYLTWFIINFLICLQFYKDISLSFLEVASQVSHPFMTTNKMKNYTSNEQLLMSWDNKWMLAFGHCHYLKKSWKSCEWKMHQWIWHVFLAHPSNIIFLLCSTKDMIGLIWHLWDILSF